MQDSFTQKMMSYNQRIALFPNVILRAFQKTCSPL